MLSLQVQSGHWSFLTEIIFLEQTQIRAYCIWISMKMFWVLECCLDINSLWKSDPLGALQCRDQLLQKSNKAEGLKRLTIKKPFFSQVKSEWLIIQTCHVSVTMKCAVSWLCYRNPCEHVHVEHVESSTRVHLSKIMKNMSYHTMNVPSLNQHTSQFHINDNDPNYYNTHNKISCHPEPRIFYVVI